MNYDKKSPFFESRQAVFDKYFTTYQHPLKKAILKLLLVSDFALRHIDLIQLLLQEESLEQLDYKNYLEQVENLDTKSQQAFSLALRRYRNYHFLRLLLREAASLATTVETMQDWSLCADALITKTLDYCEKFLISTYGIPYDEAKNPAELYTLALGKLGGRELNYSSDIDLIFAYSASGFTAGENSISNLDFYTKLVQLFVQLMQTHTKDGFVFRVDLRLRPNGESGALVSSLAYMESYYQEQGRDWERYAMIKARLVTLSDQDSESWLNRILKPFVYRRYVDFSVIDSLRGMKAMIEREIQLNPLKDDIKRGSGGIREIEFIIQNIQLIRGGRMPELRRSNALEALKIIREAKLLPKTKVLEAAYIFLRKLENCLQAANDQQTHLLPEDPDKQAQITVAMEESSWESLTKKLCQTQMAVSSIFQNILSEANEHENSERILNQQLNNIWQGYIESSMAISLLTSLGFSNPSECYQLINTFRHSPRCRRLSQIAHLRLDKLMVLLLKELIGISSTKRVLLNTINLIENIVSRSVYLALLTENPLVLKELIYWFSKSPFITSLVVDQPFLLECLLSENKTWTCPSKKQLEQNLQKALSYSEEDEAKEEELRRFKLSQWLLAARAELSAVIDAQRAGHFLSDVAEIILKQVVVLACKKLSFKSYFAIIAYGKLGSREMNYDSDLDLVFIHSKAEQESIVTRLAQKILHMLTTRSQFGILYQVDTRLRPSGSSGLLVSTFEAFANYQQTKAWTWEHQALIKARVIYGSSKLRLKFSMLKKTIFEAERSAELSQDIQGMLLKLRQQFQSPALKYTRGGLLELEFFIQYLVLTNSDIKLSHYTHNLTFLKKFAKANKISVSEFKILVSAYKKYYNLLHQSTLLANQAELNPEILQEVKDITAKYWNV